MMLGTEEKLVKLCLDAHWIYRGAGNSNIALFDIITLYGPRIVELHLRQSQNFIWTEVFGEGDVDYASVVEYLRKRHQKPHLVLEQAVEKGSDNTLTPLEAHRKSVIQLRKMFSDL
jgi:inosose dehydratase